MITTGKNLGSIIGDFGSLISEQNPKYDEDGQLKSKRSGRHGQSEIRFGKKGRADQLLSHRRARSASR